jgi:hypothetical protein
MINSHVRGASAADSRGTRTRSEPTSLYVGTTTEMNVRLV